MTRRTKALTIAFAVWVGAIVATVVAFVGNRRTIHTIGRCIDQKPNGFCARYASINRRAFDAGGFWAWTFALSLSLVIAVIVIHIVTRPRSTP